MKFAIPAVVLIVVAGAIVAGVTVSENMAAGVLVVGAFLGVIAMAILCDGDEQ